MCQEIENIATEERRSIPKMKRQQDGCSNRFGLAAFIVFLCGMIGISIYGGIKGDIMRITNNYDCYGNVCGRRENPKLLANSSNSGVNTEDKPYVFQTYVDYWQWSKSLCVKQCPTVRIETNEELREYAMKTGNHLCDYNVPLSDYNQSISMRLIARGNYSQQTCAVVPVLPTVVVMGFCVRYNFSANEQEYELNQIAGLNRLQAFPESLLRDFYLAWKEVAILCVVAVAFSFLLIMCIQFLTSIVVYLIAALFVLASIALVAALWTCHLLMRMALDKQATKNVGFFLAETTSEQAFYYMAVIFSVITVLLWILLAVLIRRLRLTVGLLEECSRCLSSLPWLIMQPIWTTVFLAAFYIYWFTAFGYIMSIADPIILSTTTGCVQFESSIGAKVCWVYHVLALIWTSEFIVACQQMVVAGVVGQWYFTREGEQPRCSLVRSMGWVICHHTGTAALGSLIIGPVHMLRSFVLFVRKRLSWNSEEDPGCCVRFNTHLCCNCCANKCILHLTKMVYTVTAIEGSDFCASSHRAVSVMSSSMYRTTAQKAIFDWLFLFAKLAVCFVTTCIAVFVLMGRQDLYCYPVPVIAVSVLAFFHAHCVLSVYESIADSLTFSFSVESSSKDVKGDAGQLLGGFTMQATLSSCANSLKKLTHSVPDCDATDPECVKLNMISHNARDSKEVESKA